MLLNNFWELFSAFTNMGALANTVNASVKAYNGNTVTAAVAAASNGYNFVCGLAFLGPASANIPTMYVLSDNTSKLYYGNSVYTHQGQAQHSGVIIGTGTTAATPSDYCLSGNIITDFTATTSLSRTTTQGGFEIAATYNITNSGSTSFTIGEIAVSRNDDLSTLTNRVLIDRTVLDTPVTIPAGETKTIIYRISFNGSSAS